ncbi:LamG domain-containing protein [Okeania sp.]|uniref:LamG domain-containing protein n=1 Tax=Okeania sp. TaxID=3100323 RepID=UPI002B4B77B5|nr:LamG domain-containing protein [Okeania sp.]MEB3342258.1 LamG domain-containing protein [Okeania sp.]
MSEVATKNITFWNTTDYNYPGFGKTVEIPDGLGGKIGITYNQIDYDDAGWKGKPNGDIPITENKFLSGEIEDKFSLTGGVKSITATMPQIRTMGKENNYSITLDFSKYKASAAGSKVTDGATSGDTYLAISRFFNGTKAGDTTIKVAATTLDGSELNLGDWKLFNSGSLGKGDNARIFLDTATQTISGKNSQGKQELCPTPPNPGYSCGTGTGLGLFELPSNQRYVSITLTFKQKKIQGVRPNDLHDIYVASNTSSTSKIDATPQDQPIDINRGLQLHLPLNEIVENAAKEKEVVDVSPTKLNGKVNGATMVADDRFGNCINFDGVDDYIELSTTTVFQTDEITISFWANGGKSLPKNNSIITTYDQSNHRVVNIHLPWSDSKIYFDCGNTLTSDDTYDRIEKLAEAVDFQNKWTHWVFTKNVTTGEMNIYLNGILWQSGKGKNKPITSITKVQIGTGYGFYDGKVAHLRIYDRVLSPEEINEVMEVDGTPPPININRGLQLHLPLNEIVENAAKEKEVVDISGKKLNAKVHGARTVVDTSVGNGNCINFDGVNDYIELSATSIPQGDEITISFWANGGKSLPKTNSLLCAVDKNNHYVVNIHLPSSNSCIYFDCGNTSTSDNISDRIEKLAEAVDFQDKWTHWVFTKNVITGEMNIYLNGTLWHSGTDKNKPINSITQAKFGAGDGFYDGKVAHLRIYGRVLSLEEINEIMQVDQVEKTDTPSTDDESGETATTETTDITSTDNTTNTTQKPMEYQIYQVNGNPTIKTGYAASEWTAVIAGFNCGAKQKHKATALTLMPIVDNGEWKIKCDIKDADDRYWDVAVLFIRNNMVNRLNNFYR